MWLGLSTRETSQVERLPFDSGFGRVQEGHEGSVFVVTVPSSKTWPVRSTGKGYGLPSSDRGSWGHVTRTLHPRSPSGGDTVRVGIRRRRKRYHTSTGLQLRFYSGTKVVLFKLTKEKRTGKKYVKDCTLGSLTRDLTCSRKFPFLCDTTRPSPSTGSVLVGPLYTPGPCHFPSRTRFYSSLKFSHLVRSPEDSEPQDTWTCATKDDRSADGSLDP